MTILTTCIGAYPKPYYVPRMAWFHDVAQTGEPSPSEGTS